MSSPTPIGDHIDGEREQLPRDYDVTQLRPADPIVDPGYFETSEREQQRASRAAVTSAPDKSLSALLDAQQRLISAHYQFLQDGDLRALAAAQSDMIQAQTLALYKMGVFG